MTVFKGACILLVLLALACQSGETGELRLGKSASKAEVLLPYGYKAAMNVSLDVQYAETRYYWDFGVPETRNEEHLYDLEVTLTYFPLDDYADNVERFRVGVASELYTTSWSPWEKKSITGHGDGLVWNEGSLVSVSHTGSFSKVPLTPGEQYEFYGELALWNKRTLPTEPSSFVFTAPVPTGPEVSYAHAFCDRSGRVRSGDFRTASLLARP